MKQDSFVGILPAVVTPMDEDGAFIPAAFERLIERLYSSGIDGIYVCGQTGEGLQQTREQRQKVTEAAVRLSPAGKQVIVHVGAMSTSETVSLAQHAERAGAQAVSALPPIGNYSFSEVKSYYTAIAGSTSLPLIIYYFPALGPAVKTVDQILELCRIPGVIGMKYTDPDLFRLSEVRKSGATIFFGTDEMLLAGLIMGATGGIGSFYNVAPELFVKAFQLASSGQWEDARKVQSSINELIAIGLKFPVNPVVKSMLRLQGYDCGICAEPRRRLSSDEETLLRELLGASSFRELFPML